MQQIVPLDPEFNACPMQKVVVYSDQSGNGKCFLQRFHSGIEHSTCLFDHPGYIQRLPVFSDTTPKQLDVCHYHARSCGCRRCYRPSSGIVKL